MWRRPLCAGFRQLGFPFPSAEMLTEHTVLSGPEPEPLSLFIHTAVCLLKAKGQLYSSPKRKQKSQRALTGNKTRSVTNWMLSKLKVTNTMLFTSKGLGCGVRLASFKHKAHRTQLEMEQILCGSDFRCRDGAMWGKPLWGWCHRSGQCVVTYLSNRKRHFFSATFRVAAYRQAIRTLKQNITQVM